MMNCCAELDWNPHYAGKPTTATRCKLFFFSVKCEFTLNLICSVTIFPFRTDGCHIKACAFDRHRARRAPNMNTFLFTL